MQFQLEEELKKLPAKPGVYLMHDEKGNIIYVGKAISLKNRVRQYFQNGQKRMPKIQRMVEQIAYFETILVDSEMEALVLECNLIKEHRPKYNTMLMDDKSYPYIKVTVYEDFPRVLFARERKKDKAKYFGPYTNAGAVKDILELLKQIYLLRSCNKHLPREKADRPCLYYHMKQCKAPCQNYISKEEYGKAIEEVIDFLEGNYDILRKDLQTKMNEAAEKLDFEEAARYRDLLKSVNQLAQKQKVTDGEEEDRDILAFACLENQAVVQVFFIREGKMIGREHFHLEGVEHETDSEILTNFIKQYYAGTPYIPKELLVPCPTLEETLLTDWLSSKRKQKVRIKVPKRGDKERLVELAQKNAMLVLQQDGERLKREEAKTKGAMQELAALLSLPILQRIESFDISNISGFESVGSMVVYEQGKPKKADYRKFRIRTVVGSDDYASMKEVLTRRFLHGLHEKEANEQKERSSFTIFPDLLLMDGGRGQVNVALRVLEELNLEIPVCGMVKDENHRTRGLYYHNQEIQIEGRGEAFQFITRIQDETHRFAIEYHRMLRSKAQVHSILDDIPGVGEKRRRALMKYFKSFEAISTASVEELTKVPTMNQRCANQVYEFFHLGKENQQKTAAKPLS